MAVFRTAAAALAVTAAISTLGTVTAAEALAAKANPACSGKSVSMWQDYVFTGTGFQANRTYLVRIATPSGDTFWPTASADAAGVWTETWLADQSGTYTATAFSGNGKLLATCSLVAS